MTVWPGQRKYDGVVRTMESLILAVHIVIGLAIIVFVLLQQGKGAEAGASFGAGASQTLFGSVGTWNFFSKVTAFLATAFFITSFTLAVLASKNTEVDSQLLPELEMLEQVPDTGEVPEIPTLNASPADRSTSAAEIPELELPQLENSSLDEDSIEPDAIDQQLPSQP